MYNPVKTTKHYLQVSVLPTLATANDDSTGIILFTTPFGPQVKISNLDSALEYLKVAFVISRMASTADSPTKQLPSGSALLYSSSHIYTAVTTFNTPVAVIQGTASSSPPPPPPPEEG